MKNKKNILVVSLIIFAFINAIYIIIILSIRKNLNECYFIIDSLEQLSYVRFGEECEYFGKQEDSLLIYLPPPDYFLEDVVTSSDAESFWPTSVYMYLKKDEITMPIQIRQYVWHNLISERNVLDLCFAMRDSVWIAVECLEYNSNQVEF